VELVFTPQGGGEKQRMEVYDFKGPGVSIGMFNTDESIEAFAHSSLQVKQLSCKGLMEPNVGDKRSNGIQNMCTDCLQF
jgi:hypothetical protein